MMGREIRRVPANWEHPRRDCPHSPWRGGCDEAKQHDGKCYHPLFDEDIETAGRKWLDRCIAWDNGTHPDLIERPELKEKYPFFWMWDGGSPDPEYYRPKFETEPTWYQIYETVSEGTPVTPPFATKEELVNYLVEHGDFWDQTRGNGGWERKNAEQFVKAEWAPSLIMFTSPQGNIIHAARDGDIEAQP
jgi:hypothetical protein